MTRDQLFALPVGTRLRLESGLEYIVDGRESDHSRLRQVGTRRVIRCFRGKSPETFNAEVIPGELDASEVVE